MDEDLIARTDIERIAREGTRIYESIKSQYDPVHHGKFLAIDVESKEVFLAPTSVEALLLARKKYPSHIFYVAKIGYEFTQTIAELFSDW